MATNDNGIEAATSARRHQACFRDDPCAEGDPKTCPAVAADERRARARREGAWGELVVRREDGGRRHYLDDQPVHCGAALELQALEDKVDDYGEYTVFRQEGIPVRYEAALGGLEPVVTLYAGKGGHQFMATGQPWMRFRWPRRDD